MPELSRAQIAVYAAVAVVALMLGARWIRSSGEGATAGASAPTHSVSSGEEQSTLKPSGGDIVVHVAGAVQDPGVYRMPDGSRVTDAIERAGGPTRDAAPNALNLAAPLADGQQVVLPSDAPTAAGASTASAPDAPISLGTATVEELDTIEGIGPVTAAAIIEFRDSGGGVGSIDELDEVSGIGPTTLEALRARLQP